MTKNFKDFWTPDMKQFYDESWGHENFDHNTVISSMPVDREKWKINPADRNQLSNKRRGYFCTNCRTHIRMQHTCIKLPSPKCSVCGLSGHYHYNCPNAICTTCRSATKYHTVTCYNCQNVRSLKCNICKAIGHQTTHCPDLWRRYHQTTKIQKILKSSKESAKLEYTLWCSNCATQGHPADKCKFPCQDRILSTTQIFSYEATYDIDSKLEQPNTLTSMTGSNKKKPYFEKKVQNYRRILEKLKKKCNKSDSNLLENVNEFLDEIKNNTFSAKMFKQVKKLRKKFKNG